MSEVINLDDHRDRPGYVWATCTVRCTECAFIHVAVQEMPDWAAVPASCECPRCHAPHSCLPMAEPPDKVDQEPLVEWPYLSVIVGGLLYDAYPGSVVGESYTFEPGGSGIVRRSRPFKLQDIGAGWAKILAQDIADDASEFAAQSENLYGDWDNPPELLDGAEEELRAIVSSWTRRYLVFDLTEVEVHGL